MADARPYGAPGRTGDADDAERGVEVGGERASIADVVSTGTGLSDLANPRLWLYAFGAFTVLTVLSTAEHAAYVLHQGGTVAWSAILIDRALEEYTCALFVPALFWLVHRFPIDRRAWRRSVPVLLSATVVFTAVKYALLQAIYATAWYHRLWPGPPILYTTLLELNAVSVTLDFWSVIGVAHAIEYYRRAQERDRTAAVLRARLSRAQLDALRAQLHPHFLFNTLNGVATLMHRDVEGADRMLTHLADLLRHSLQYPAPHQIPLGEELALLDRYLAIVRTRFGDRLVVECDVPPAVRAALVPHFLLQPLVENALEHGIAQRPGPGRIEIRATRHDDQLRITVQDDGPGPGAAKADAGDQGCGVGLANTRARLQQLYGSAHTLTLATAAPSGGALAAVSLPFRLAPARAAGTGAPT